MWKGLLHIENIDHALAVAIVERYQATLEQAKELVKDTYLRNDFLCDDLSPKRIRFWANHIGRGLQPRA